MFWSTDPGMKITWPNINDHFYNRGVIMTDPEEGYLVGTLQYHRVLARLSDLEDEVKKLKKRKKGG